MIYERTSLLTMVSQKQYRVARRVHKGDLDMTEVRHLHLLKQRTIRVNLVPELPDYKNHANCKTGKILNACRLRYGLHLFGYIGSNREDHHAQVVAKLSPDTITAMCMADSIYETTFLKVVLRLNRIGQPHISDTTILLYVLHPIRLLHRACLFDIHGASRSLWNQLVEVPARLKSGMENDKKDIIKAEALPLYA